MLKKVVLLLGTMAFLFTQANAAEVSKLEDTQPTSLTRSGSSGGSSGPYFGVAAGLVLGGVLTLISANSYEDKYSDPRKYDQKDAKSKADTLRALAYGEFGAAAVLALVGLNKLEVNKSTNVSIENNGMGTMIVAKHQF